MSLSDIEKATTFVKAYESGLLSFIPQDEWTEEMAIQVIRQISEENYDDVMDKIPLHCYTYRFWLNTGIFRPKILRRVPIGVATQTFYEDVVSGNSELLREVPYAYRTAKLCNIAINGATAGDRSLLIEIPEEIQTEEMILKAINLHGGTEMFYAAFQTRDICMSAVENAPYVIEFVKEPTFEICEMAIRTAAADADDYALIEVVKCIKKHTPEICACVLRYRPLALEHLRILSHEVNMVAIQFSTPSEVPLVLSYVREQTLEVCLAAYRKSHEAYYQIRKAYLRRWMARLVMATDVLIPLRGADLSTSLLIEVCEAATPVLYPSPAWRMIIGLTLPQLWKLAKLIKERA